MKTRQARKLTRKYVPVRPDLSREPQLFSKPVISKISKQSLAWRQTSLERCKKEIDRATEQN